MNANPQVSFFLYAAIFFLFKLNIRFFLILSHQTFSISFVFCVQIADHMCQSPALVLLEKKKQFGERKVKFRAI